MKWKRKYMIDLLISHGKNRIVNSILKYIKLLSFNRNSLCGWVSMLDIKKCNKRITDIIYVYTKIYRIFYFYFVQELTIEWQWKYYWMLLYVNKQKVHNLIVYNFPLVCFRPEVKWVCVLLTMLDEPYFISLLKCFTEFSNR